MQFFEWPLPWGHSRDDKSESLRIDDEDLRGLVPACLGAAPNLRSFRFCPGDLLPSGFLRHFAQQCPLVEELVLDYLGYSGRRELKEFMRSS